MRRAARTDDNQDEIVKALRKCGFQVEIIGKPVDLLVANRQRTFILEVKNEDGADRLTQYQIEFLARWPGEFHIVKTVSQALEAALGKKAMQ